MELDFDVKLTIQLLEERIYKLEGRLKEVERFQEITHLQYQKNIGLNQPMKLPSCVHGLVSHCQVCDSELEKLIKVKDDAYKERNMCIAALANFIHDTAQPNWRIYVAYHEDPGWEEDWRTILVIEKGSTQMTWHFHDSEKHLLARLSKASIYKWDGHDTKEKYRRLMACFIGCLT